jgi:hypothetical protein
MRHLFLSRAGGRAVGHRRRAFKSGCPAQPASYVAIYEARPEPDATTVKGGSIAMATMLQPLAPWMRDQRAGGPEDRV